MKPCVFGEGKGAYDDIEELSFGMMYHGITYADEAYSEETKGKLSVRLWQATMKKGIIEYLPPWECIHSVRREMNVKPFGHEVNNFSWITEMEVME